MIQMWYREDRYAPVIVCDTCEQRISDVQLAAVVFRHGEPGAGELLPVMHVHKGKCHDAAEVKLGGPAACGWLEMTQHLLHLVTNTGLTPEEMVTRRDERDAAGDFPD